MLNGRSLKDFLAKQVHLQATWLAGLAGQQFLTRLAGGAPTSSSQQRVSNFWQKHQKQDEQVQQPMQACPG